MLFRSYHGLPTEGTRQKTVCSLSGPSAYWSVKVSDLETGRFCTFIPYVRGRVEYVPVDVRTFLDLRRERE